MSRLTNGGIIGKAVTVPNNAAAIGKWNISDQHIYKQQDIWTTEIPLSGLLIWYDAADTSTITLSSGKVSQINDKSGNGRHATQSTQSLRPTYTTLNGKPILDFTTVSTERMLISNPYTFSSKSVHFFAVGATRYENNSDYSAFIGSYGASGGGETIGTLSYSFPGNGGSSGQQQLLNTSIAWFPAGTKNDYIAGQLYNVNASWNGSTVSYRQNRTDDGSGSYSGNITHVTDTLGWQEGSTYGSTIRIAELIIYNAPLSTNQRNLVENYLYAKWGV